MPFLDLYHNCFGDQGKALADVAKWGAICVGLYTTEYRYAKRRKAVRYQARTKLYDKFPDVRLHISGEKYVH